MATYYVSAQNGSDSNAGTSVGAAKASYSAGIALLSSAGDKLYIGPGYYPESATVNMVGDGSFTDPIQIIGDPEAEFLTSDNPGEVVVASRDSDGIGQNTYLMNFSTDEHFYVKNITFIAGKGSAARCINMSDSEGLFFENCHFVGGFYGVYGDNDHDLTAYNCSFIGCRIGARAINGVHCVGVCGYNAFYQGYYYGCIAIGGFYGFSSCHNDNYGYSGTGYGSVYNCFSLGNYTGTRDCSGQNHMAYGAGNEGIEFGGHYMIGGLSMASYRAFGDGELGNGTGVFPGVNSGSENSTMMAMQDYGNNDNYSPDDADFTTTDVGGCTYIGYSGMARDIAQIVRPRQPLGSGFQLLPTGSTGKDYSSLKITGSDATAGFNDRTEALQAFVSGAGLRFAANALKDTYIPPAERDIIGTPMRNLSQTPGYTDYDRTKGGFPGPYYPNEHELEFGASYISGSDHAIKLTDYGSFNIGSYAHNSITASVGVKYNAGTAPEIRIVNIDTGHPIVTQAASGTGDQTSAYQHLSIQTTASGHVNIVLASPHLPQGTAPHVGSGAIVYFTDLKINEG
tara:strand:- start:3215 stop:4915 length:1701 start_codon:yes stop_codon:yes gene_type:complete